LHARSLLPPRLKQASTSQDPISLLSDGEELPMAPYNTPRAGKRKCEELEAVVVDGQVVWID